MMLRNVLIALAVCAASAAWSKEAVPVAADPAIEARTMKLAEVLRCLVCQNQTIADSNADLAVDLRKQIREQLQAGKTDEQVKEYMVQRYGDFVLYHPPFKNSTVLLWVGPFVLLVLAFAVLYRTLVAGRREKPNLEPTAEERARAQALLARGGDKS